MVGSCSDHGRIALALAEAIDTFFGRYIFVSGAIVGDVRGRILWLVVSCVTRTTHPCHLSRHAQYLVMFDVRAPLFMAGAICGESLGNSRSEKRSIFPYKARRRDGTRKLRERARNSTVHRGV